MNYKFDVNVCVNKKPHGWFINIGQLFTLEIIPDHAPDEKDYLKSFSIYNAADGSCVQNEFQSQKEALSWIFEELGIRKIREKTKI